MRGLAPGLSLHSGTSLSSAVPCCNFHLSVARCAEAALWQHVFIRAEEHHEAGGSRVAVGQGGHGRRSTIQRGLTCMAALDTFEASNPISAPLLFLSSNQSQFPSPFPSGTISSLPMALAVQLVFIQMWAEQIEGMASPITRGRSLQDRV